MEHTLDADTRDTAAARGLLCTAGRTALRAAGAVVFSTRPILSTDETNNRARRQFRVNGTKQLRLRTVKILPGDSVYRLAVRSVPSASLATCGADRREPT